jgi:tetratricopeptide (TPR) repeat protein
MATSYHQLGTLNETRGDLKAAEKWYRKSLEIAEKLNNRPEMASSYNGLGNVALGRGDLKDAEHWYGKALAAAEERSSHLDIAHSLQGLGLIAQRRGDLEAAERLYQKSLEIKEQLYDSLGTAASFSVWPAAMASSDCLLKRAEISQRDWSGWCVASRCFQSFHIRQPGQDRSISPGSRPSSACRHWKQAGSAAPARHYRPTFARKWRK